MYNWATLGPSVRATVKVTAAVEKQVGVAHRGLGMQQEEQSHVPVAARIQTCQLRHAAILFQRQPGCVAAPARRQGAHDSRLKACVSAACRHGALRASQHVPQTELLP